MLLQFVSSSHSTRVIIDKDIFITCLTNNNKIWYRNCFIFILIIDNKYSKTLNTCTNEKIVFQINLVLEIVKAFIVSSFKLSEKRERKMLMVMLSIQHENTLMI